MVGREKWAEFADAAPIGEGEIVVITTGAYSDYTVRLLAVATVKICIHDEVVKYLERHPEQGNDDEFEWSQFIREALLDKVKLLDWREVHLESYSSVSEGWMTRHDSEEGL